MWRDFRGGELTALIFSLILATATVTSISLFTNRIQNSILDEATELLAADAQVRSSLPIKPEWLTIAKQEGLQTAELRSFRSMLFSNDGMQLSSVKATSENYPLKGAVTLANSPYGEQTSNYASGPKRGEIWLVSRLFAALNIKPGDSISLGDAEFEVTKALIKEPDSPETFFGVAPRAIMHIDDIEKTGAVRTGSRINYTLLVAGNSVALAKFKQAIAPDFGNHARWVDVENGNRNIGAALKRAEQFLLLAGSLSVMLCGVAIALSARRYAIRQSNCVALLKTFGQTPSQITQRYMVVLMILGTLAVVSGAISGYILHLLILQFLADLIPTQLADASGNAFIIGAVSGLLALFAFAGPPLLSLRRVAPAAILRQDTSVGLIHPAKSAVIGVICLTALLLLYSRSWVISGILLAGSVSILVFGSAMAWLVLAAARKLSHRASNAWRLGIANLKRHQGFNAVQIIIFSVLFMLLLVLFDSRTSLIHQWEQQAPDQAANHFIFNIFNNDKAAIETLLKDNAITYSPLYPMTRGRLVTINGEPVKPRIETTESRMNYERELNLTWATELGADNTVISGDWHGSRVNSAQVSAEQEYAKGLDLQLGDKLTFSVAGQEITAELTSIRSVRWDSMNPNFFMIFNQPLLENTASNWLTSFYLPAEEKNFINKLARNFPTVSIIELDQMLAQVKSIIRQVTMAVEFVLVLVLAAGFMVLVTSIQSTLDVRFQESAILRALGAKRRFVNRVLMIEFATLGFISGILGATGAQICLFFLQTRVFNLPALISFQVLFFGPILGIILIGSVGWVSTRRVTYRPPLNVLRDL